MTKGIFIIFTVIFTNTQSKPYLEALMIKTIYFVLKSHYQIEKKKKIMIKFITVNVHSCD